MFKKISLAALVLVVILALAWLVFFKEKNNNSDENQLSALELMQQQQANKDQEVDKDKEKNKEKVQGEIEIPGANAITKEQIVVTDTGQAVKANVMPNSPEAPKAVTIEKKQLTEKMVQIKINNNKFSPDSFKVSVGEAVSLAFISEDTKTHVITFSSNSLAALAFGVSGGKVKAMSFNAPLSPGKYEFKCDVPGHSAQGETGFMIVE